jgi:hypothetical protein
MVNSIIKHLRQFYPYHNGRRIGVLLIVADNGTGGTDLFYYMLEVLLEIQKKLGT